MKALVPVLALNLPAMHAAQPAAFEPVKPRLRRHMLASLLPATETAFVLQETQVDTAVAPVEAEYVPTPHGVHVALPVVIL